MVERLLAQMPTGEVAGQAWRDYGQVIVAEDYEEMLQIADEIASEHVQVMTDRDDWFLERMTNYGALFLGPRTNVAYGDKVIGTNHPADRQGGALHRRPVGRQVPQDLHLAEGADRSGQRHGRAYCSRLCALEGFAGHGEQANLRLRRYGGRNVPPYGAPEGP